MSHQFHEGWFPECIVCESGNVGPIVCLNPICHENHGMKLIEPKKKYMAGDLCDDEKLIKEDGHWWKCCQLCESKVHADPGAFGSYAICVDCFNEYISRGECPPTSPFQRDMI
jgi:hypothetical protein